MHAEQLVYIRCICIRHEPVHALAKRIGMHNHVNGRDITKRFRIDALHFLIVAMNPFFHFRAVLYRNHVLIANKIHQVVIVIFHMLFICQILLVSYPDIATLIVKYVNICEPIPVCPQLPEARLLHLQHILRLEKFTLAIPHLVRIGQECRFIIVFFQYWLCEQTGIIATILER
ncbi:hypothetical protein D3C80_1294090 [compost metagenome]